MKNRLFISVVILLFSALACNLGSPAKNPSENTGQTQQPGNASRTEVPIFKLPGGTPPARPISINEGLASLNSYKTTISIISSGPSPKDSSNTVIETQRSEDKDAQVTNMTSKTINDGVPSQDNTNSQIYRIGNDQCSGSGKEWDYSSMAPNQAEMMDMVMSMFSFTPTTDNSVFVASETVNGIAANHFTFKVKGLGNKSGANVTINQGDYWLAVDGQYIVRYTLKTETVVDPKTNVLHMEILFEVKDINQPVSIAFPQGCLDASKITPTAPAQSDQPPADISTTNSNTGSNANPGQAPFAGIWSTNFGDMLCAVDGQKVNCTYTHNKGRIEGYMNPDGKSYEGSWFESPTYKPPDHAGRVVMTVSDDGMSFTGHWWHGPAEEGGEWTGARK